MVAGGPDRVHDGRTSVPRARRTSRTPLAGAGLPVDRRQRASRAATLAPMTDDPRHDDEHSQPEYETPRWTEPATYRRRDGWGFLPWLIGAAVVLVLALAGGLGAAYLVAQIQAAPTPRTALPPPTPSPAATSTLAPTAPPTDDAASPTAEPEPTDGPATPDVEATPREHVVARGESISLIALEYGVTIEEIVALNELENPDVIVPGQRLLIPPP